MVHTDLNCLSVLQFAIEVLKVRHVIVRAALRQERLGLSGNWLRHLQDVRQKHERLLDGGDEGGAADRLCELNVIEQVVNVCQTTIAREAWERGQELSVHGWIYGLQDGLLRDLKMTITRADEAVAMHRSAVAALA